MSTEQSVRWKAWNPNATIHLTSVSMEKNVDNIESWTGIIATDLMLSDAEQLGTTSPAASCAKDCVLNVGGISYSGYIGTKNQFSVLYAKKRYDCVFMTMKKLGYVNRYFKASPRIWSSTRLVAFSKCAAYTYADNYGWISDGGSVSDSFNSSVVPIFSIPIG